MAALATHARLAGCQAGQQRGAVLGVALLLLTVLTLLALGASQLRRTQETATRSIQQRALAFQAAEAALRHAERLIDSSPMPTGASCDSQRCRIYRRGQLDNISRRTTDWWEQYAWAYSASETRWIPANPQDRTTARFVIEELAFVPDSLTVASTGTPAGQVFYRIVAIAHSDSGVAPVVLQSTYSRHVS